MGKGESAGDRTSFVHKLMNQENVISTSRTQSRENLGSFPLWKRTLDITCIIVAVPVLLPPALLICLLIKLVSRGPVLFRQERIGHRGRPFMCLKFRTMRVDADHTVHKAHLKELMDSNAPMVKMDARDERVIPLGALLRASGLDELPQVINVLKGEMSLVGPRPCMRYEYDEYLPWHKERFNAVPGLTGLWQVSGKNRTTFDEMIRLDIRYYQNQSLWLDSSIIAKTIPALIVQMRDMRRGKKGRTALPLGTKSHHRDDRRTSTYARNLTRRHSEQFVQSLTVEGK